MSKKGVVLKINTCRTCKNGYRMFLYHQRTSNDKIMVGSNCVCERSEVNINHVSNLRDEILHPEKYAPSLFYMSGKQAIEYLT